MKLYKASELEKKDGWTLAVEFLKDIQKEVEWSINLEDEDTPSLEQIEMTLLAYQKVSNRY